MINEENKTEVIDLYLNQQLEGDQLKEFKDLLEQDEVFRSEVEAQKAVIAHVVDKAQEEEMRNRFNKFHQEMKSESKNPDESIQMGESSSAKVKQLNSRQSYWLLVASAAAIAVFALWYFNVEDKELSPAITKAEEFLIVPLETIDETGLGYAEQGEAGDSMQVIIKQDPLYSFHYRFKDSLELFLGPDILLENIRLSRSSLDTYFLQLDSISYPLDRGYNNIYELKQ